MATLVIALDFPAAQPACKLAKQLAGSNVWVKVGLELFIAEGPGIIDTLRAMDLKVFVDLKFKDIPHTVAAAVRSATRAGADMLTLHTTGGQRMLEAAREACDGAAGAGGHRPALVGVTVLTSIGTSEMSAVSGTAELSDTVLSLAGRAHQAGLDGVVCSGFEVSAIHNRYGRDFICVTPGIRLPGTAADDQRRVMSPQEAVRAGAQYLVAGRPVTRAPDPRKAVETILENMHKAAIQDTGPQDC